jgi:putative ABC transport system permease protein
MLQLIDIKKTYTIGKPKDKEYQVTQALKGVSVKFRDSEFVSILGASGCGKTTLLNIVGGLDKYTSGDLVINGVSTKEYKDKDWDNYRNNSVGFVFQSYNLIPHQTVLENVELALTLSGVNRKERKQMAVDALQKVGLADKIHAKPNQLSGGQMQRVAIARALVNNPEIILADEPTGALDTKTSIQVMELLKEVSKDRLVIMVTHNPELAQNYSSRIIRIKDGELVDDSNPYDGKIEQAKSKTKAKAEAATQAAVVADVAAGSKNTQEPKPKHAKKRKKNMSFFTALSLSFKNLLTKKARTLLVSFAGSIGIIGIALVLSLSSGFQNYITRVQQDTLSNYPITISQSSTDYSKIMQAMFGTGDSTKKDIDQTKVYSNNNLSSMFGMLSGGTTKNDLKSFKQYLDREDVSQKLKDVATIKYTYDLSLNLFYNNSAYVPEGKSLLVNPFNLMPSLTSNGSFSKMIADSFEEMIDNKELLQSQYDLVAGSWAKDDVYTDGTQNIAEVMIVLDENNAIADYTLMILGLRDRKDIDMLMVPDTDPDQLSAGFDMSVDDLLKLEYSLVLNPNMYVYNEDTGLYDAVETQNLNTNAMSQAYYSIDVIDTDFVTANTDVTLKVAGVIKPNADATATALTGTVCYTKGLSTYVVNRLSAYANDQTIEHNILADQLKEENANRSVISGKPFEMTASQMYAYYQTNSAEYNALTDDEKQILADYATASQNIYAAASNLLAQFGQQPSSQETVIAEATALATEQMANYSTLSTEQQAALSQFSSAASAYQLQDSKVVASFSSKLLDGSTLADTLVTLGQSDIDNPASISFYAKDFESKSVIESVIDDYNAMVLADPNLGEDYVVSYTDYVGLMMSSISIIITAITYVLIAFVSISLVVSSIMIGIITYISVLERTKEIGVLRSVGASKRDIKRVFTAESLIIGLIAGVLGIVITLILNPIVNIVIQHYTNLANIASLPWLGAVVLILISMALTFIAGLIPAKYASKKDPVIALRSE